MSIDMYQGPDMSAGYPKVPPRVGEFRRVTRVLLGRKVVAVGIIIILMTIIAAIFAPLLAPYDPYQVNIKEALLQPSREHLLGTDALGRDTLSRIIFGTRTSMIIAVIAVGISATGGMTLGLIAGYLGGITNTIIMRFVDALMAFPMIILSLTIATLLGGGLRAVIIAVGIGLMSLYARLMWGQVMTVKQNDYILAEQAQGSSNLRIMLQHILPNCFPVLIVTVTMQMGAAILAEAGLSFLGVGIKPPGAAWGFMISDGYYYLTSHPILSIAPGVAIILLVFAFNMVGDGLRDALDPRLRGKL
jgi:peptide/nickel transport system permease protein